MSSDFWAGYLSGAVSIVIGNPLDLIKVRVQAARTQLKPDRPPTRWSLLAGLPAPVLTYGALNALLYTSYNRTLALLPASDLRGQAGSGDQSHGLHHPPWAQFLAGTVAGFATFVISAPTEYVKCRAQVTEQAVQTEVSSTRRPTTSWAIAKETVRSHGIRGLYVGGVVTSLRDAVGYGFYFLTYEVSRRSWEAHVIERRPAGSVLGRDGSGEAVGILLCGGLAGVATWASIFPLDVIKTRVQTQEMYGEGSLIAGQPVGAHEQSLRTPLLNGSTTRPDPISSRSAAPALKRHKGAWTTAREAYAHEGLAVFWRGLGVCCLRAFVVNAVQWTVYEWAMKSLK